MKPLMGPTRPRALKARCAALGIGILGKAVRVGAGHRTEAYSPGRPVVPASEMLKDP